ncbi:hypothetical protein TA3x_000506 [Tundrisphaera sp. TA3]|uniref:hypothetical protein n=1 Tax=Tundrisphaera sp. TA3 TaxID=3435775 RepID=UPI003EBD61D0
MAKKKPKPAEPVEPEEISQEVPETEPEFNTDDDIEAELEEAKSPAKAMNKSQAARSAIDAGYEKPGPAVEYIKAEFGIDMNPQHFSAIKSNYKKKQGDAPAETPAPKRAASPAPAAKSAAGAGDPGLLTDLAAVKHLVERLGAEQVRQIVGLFE